MKETFYGESTLDVKRFYMDGVQFKRPCPNCKAEVEKDFAYDYLSFPKVNKPIHLHMYCTGCEHEWQIKAKLNMSLELLE